MTGPGITGPGRNGSEGDPASEAEAWPVHPATGPLAGVRVIELHGIGPAPFAGMMLSDMGAEVIQVERAEDARSGRRSGLPWDLLTRGRRSVGLDLKRPEGAEVLLRMVEVADALVEGFRPGVAERLGIGPDVCLERNPALVYGRMTGWGQDGPYAPRAGHDINYISLAGALEPIGRAGQAPVPPLNLVGDFGGGGMFLAFGVVCALLEAANSGEGQVVDAAMVDGAASLMGFIHGMDHMGQWQPERGTNQLDTGAHYYDVYETSDGKYVSVGAIEPKFYAELLGLLGIDPGELPGQNDRAHWPALKERLAAVFRTRTRDQWCELLEGTDACFAPVLSMAEAPSHPHNRVRGTFTDLGGIRQPGPAPRFSRTPGAIQGPPPAPGQHTDEVLAEWGFDLSEIADLRGSGVIG